MSVTLTDGDLYDTAMTVAAMHEIAFEGLEWIETSKSRRIAFKKNYTTGGIAFIIHGLPLDIPFDVFEDLLDNAIRWDLKKDKTTTVKQTTRNWLTHTRTVKV